MVRFSQFFFWGGSPYPQGYGGRAGTGKNLLRVEIVVGYAALETRLHGGWVAKKPHVGTCWMLRIEDGQVVGWEALRLTSLLKTQLSSYLLV